MLRCASADEYVQNNKERGEDAGEVGSWLLRGALARAAVVCSSKLGLRDVARPIARSTRLGPRLSQPASLFCTANKNAKESLKLCANSWGARDLWMCSWFAAF